MAGEKHLAFLERGALKHHFPASCVLVALAFLPSLSQVQAQTNAGSATSNAVALRATELRKQVPAGFTVVAQPPFVVIGDEPVATVQRRATDTVKRAVDGLKQVYFRRDPAEIIEIWLFKDKASYTNHARSLFNDTPNTPIGYYSTAHHALIMDISTGSGTLVHEIVHPFMSANFPGCPPWFNEGLASLYEASSWKDGQIQGLINWRLNGLEQAIKDGKTVSFKQLTAMSDQEFYGGINSANYNQHYAQARYLCYYLQENGLLVKYYHDFTANAKTDPTGYAALQRILSERDMDVFKKKWERFILELRGQ
jgi:hypothetical protein